MAANQDFVHGKYQTKGLLFAFAFEFRVGELVVWQQQRAVRGQFDPNGAGLRVVGPAFGWFGVHVDVPVEGCGGEAGFS